MATTKPKKKSAVAAARKKQPPWLWIGVARPRPRPGGGGGRVLRRLRRRQADSRRRGGDPVGDRHRRRPAPAAPESGADPGVGKEIPDLKGQSFDGTPVTHHQGRQAEARPLRRPLVPPLPEGGAAPGRLPEVEPAPGRRPLHRVDVGGVESPNYPPSAWLDEEGWASRRWPTPATRRRPTPSACRPSPTSWPSTPPGRSWPARPARSPPTTSPPSPPRPGAAEVKRPPVKGIPVTPP